MNLHKVALYLTYIAFRLEHVALGRENVPEVYPKERPMKNRTNTIPTAEEQLAGGGSDAADDPPAKPKKPFPTGAALFSLVWKRCARELSRLPNDNQRRQAIEFVQDELGMVPINARE